jgi:uncharacterized protein
VRWLGAATGVSADGLSSSHVVADAAHRTTREIDVVALAAGERGRSRVSRITCIGEAKSSDRERTSDDLARLERVRALLVADGADCAHAKLILFGRSGFSPQLEATAAERPDVELVDLNRLYTGD